MALFSATAAAWLAFEAAEALGADVAAGRHKAVQCQACHGLDGLSKLPEAPHIAGQPVPYLIKSMNEYRKGVRKNEIDELSSWSSSPMRTWLISPPTTPRSSWLQSLRVSASRSRSAG